FSAVNYVATRLQAIPRFGKMRLGLLRYSLVGLISLLVFSGNAVAAFNKHLSCPESFSPISSTPITEYLDQTIAFHPGWPFRGLIATFTGYQKRPSVNWFDLHNYDYALWKETGNDHRTVGLWHYNIPTLLQYSSLMTPTYYLTVSRVLTRPEDKQMRAIIVLTRPNEQMLKLLGVRFLIVDFDVGFGTSRVSLSVSDHWVLHLVELDGFNRGQYSPTEAINARDFRSALALLRDPSFDGSREVITDVNFAGPLQRATAVELKVEKYGFSIRASSSGRSILVLPAQFSHCWTAQGEGDPVLFRANIMQLGISFAGRLDASLKFRYGPLLAAQCRLEDLRDMALFDVRSAAVPPDQHAN